MAAKLQCEICGGKLIGKPGGIFECDSCGMEYDTAWAKAKIQEITGTVKVEGTVEVQGSVKVEGPITVEGINNKKSLLAHGYLSLEDGEWNKAEELFNSVLNVEAHCAEAYLGIALAHAQLHDSSEIVSLILYRKIKALTNDTYYQRFNRFATSEQRAAIDIILKEATEKTVSERELQVYLRGRVVAGHDFTIGVQSNGKVLAAGINDGALLNVLDWKNTISISTGKKFVVGLCSDGTVVAEGRDYDDYGRHIGNCDVDNWTDIVAISAGYEHTVGLRSDGTVIISGKNDCEKCRTWTDITAIAAGNGFTIGLQSNGTVMATGRNDCGQCNVHDWEGIIAVDAGEHHTVGLRANGAVICTGSNSFGQCNVSEWKDIVAVSAGTYFTAGLRADGTVLTTEFVKGNGQDIVRDWHDIIAISAGYDHTIGLRSDGTFLAAGKDFNGRCDVQGWKLFESLETFVKEQEYAAKYAEQIRIKASARKKQEMIATSQRLLEEQVSLRTELSNLKGLFSEKRRTELKARLAAIDAEIKKLQ